jgi:methionyl-tRNA formyltransferase
LDKIRVVLFGMTGFGNNALNALLDCSLVNLVGIFAPLRENTPFPYYKCETLHDVAMEKRITLYEGRLLRDKKTYELIKKLSPDLIVVSSFSQIIPKNIILLPKLGVINVHPSLLPKYRGATPTVWALMNGEEETGVTIHFIEDETLDRGKIIAQASLKIDPLDNDGILRLKLAILSEKVLIEAVNRILRRDKEVFPQQDESQTTYYPKRSLKDAEIDIHRPFKEILNKIRAMSPYPGAYLNCEGIRYAVTGATLLNGRGMSTNVIENKEIVVHTIEGAVKFQIKKEN